LAKTPKRWEPADVKDLLSRARSDPATASEAIDVLTLLVEAGPHLLSAEDLTSLAELKDVQKDVLGGWNASTGQGVRITVDCSRLQELAGQELVRRGLRVVEEPVADKVWLDYKTLTDCTYRVDSIVFCADGSVIAEGGGVRLWNPDTDEKQLLGASGVAMAVSPDRRIVAVARDKAVELWDARTGQKQKILEHRTKSSGGFRVWCVAYSPDGHLLASGGADYELRVWDSETGALKWTLDGQQVIAVAFSPDGRTIAAGGFGAVLRLIDASTGKVEWELHQKKDEVVQALAFSPDGTMLASGDGDNGEYKVWSLDNVATPRGIRRASLKITVSDVNHPGFGCVAFSPDGQLCASPGPRKGNVILWDPKTGEKKHQLHFHRENVMSLAFSSDGRTLASGSVDKTVHLWRRLGG
jgi:WD40 repeat protein